MAETSKRTGSADQGPQLVGSGGVAFLLAQVGAHAASRFADRVAEAGLTPPVTGLLRAIAREPGSSQQQLATRLGLLPSRVVSFIDDLEHRGLVRRERSTSDRRVYALNLTDDGHTMLRQISVLARAHEDDLCQALTDDERSHLADLLGRIAVQQGLTAGIHPGYRQIDRPSTSDR